MIRSSHYIGLLLLFDMLSQPYPGLCCFLFLSWCPHLLRLRISLTFALIKRAISATSALVIPATIIVGINVVGCKPSFIFATRPLFCSCCSISISVLANSGSIEAPPFLACTISQPNFADASVGSAYTHFCGWKRWISDYQIDVAPLSIFHWSTFDPIDLFFRLASFQREHIDTLISQIRTSLPSNKSHIITITISNIECVHRILKPFIWLIDIIDVLLNP